MDWKNYENRLRTTYLEIGFSEDQINETVNYAKKLHNQNLPIIYDSIHLSSLLGYRINFIYAVTNKTSSFYRYYKIPKKTSGFRQIAEPLPNLKEIQSWINFNILKPLENKNIYIKSYKSKMSIKDNAKFHRNQKNVFSLDIADYFSNISEGKVILFFKNLGYSLELSITLAKLCCLNKCLPQGAPTSPLLSNLITLNIDKRIFGFCKIRNIRYTRYADDLTFSGDFNTGEIFNFTKKVLSEYGFELNQKKTRNKQQHQQQKVTGIVVNKKLQVPANMRRTLRQEIYYITKFGLKEHLSKLRIKDLNYLDQILGKINFVLFVNPKDQEMIKNKEKIKQYIKTMGTS